MKEAFFLTIAFCTELFNATQAADHDLPLYAQQGSSTRHNTSHDQKVDMKYINDCEKTLSTAKQQLEALRQLTLGFFESGNSMESLGLKPSFNLLEMNTKLQSAIDSLSHVEKYVNESKTIR
ncbi:MAG: hypothetical protein FJX71_04740 [Alphaproteobacteria bacterium]|nr:hypothetical protein [Alphaproteobacteria bacterium]